MPPNFYAVAVVTMDGKIAKNSAHFSDWSSKEDKDFLHKKMNDSDVILVGNNTYKIAKKPLSKRNCIVFTSSVPKTKKAKENLLYCNPKKIDFKKLILDLGYKKICVLGGAKTYGYFLEKNLLNEIFLTIEPIVFGSGISLFDFDAGIKKFKLVSVKKLNKKGAVLLHYKK
ncbi:MAG TPA: dihydrofolate reductase family protein [archaeon]|nr:dihydrofolate reductase family protein [archaeon]